MPFWAQFLATIPAGIGGALIGVWLVDTVRARLRSTREASALPPRRQPSRAAPGRLWALLRRS